MSHLITISSDAFVEGGIIPSVHTCDGEDVSPRIALADLPAGTASWGLLCDDPDAPAGDWVHWLVFNLPPSLTTLARGVSSETLAGMGVTPGKNSWGNTRYQGPCPPSGTHRYFFKVFALDRMLDLPAGSAKAAFLAALKGHTLGHGMLMGRYARTR